MFSPYLTAADDGFTGTDFNRPAFKIMQEQIMRGDIDTVVVKDLSRFGRNYIDVGKYVEILYPSIGVRFIAVQEGVDTKKGTGTEMMPISNVFNEWYAAQTSKKLRALWKMKSEKGLHVCAKPPYGYVRHPNNKERWIIDRPAAEIVLRIYRECIDGRGSTTIAKGLTADGVLTPSAYYAAKGKKHMRVPGEEVSRWNAATVSDILRNMVYMGCAVNHKTTTLSYKINKRVTLPPEQWSITPNAHEAIVDEDTWKKAQEKYIKKKKRLETGGRESFLKGLLYCADCGSPMYLSACHEGDPIKDFFKCYGYKSYGGNCTQHYIRRVTIENLVTQAVAELADLVTESESVFLFLLETRRKTEADALKQEIEAAEFRINQLDILITRSYEDHVIGTLSTSRFTALTATYELEQSTLKSRLISAKFELENLRDNSRRRELQEAMKEFRKYGGFSNELAKRILSRVEVHEGERYGHKGREHLDIYIKGLGLLASWE